MQNFLVELWFCQRKAFLLQEKYIRSLNDHSEDSELRAVYYFFVAKLPNV